MESQKETRPVIAITMGDPAGIGPEITVKALSDPTLYRICRPIVIGDAPVLGDAVRIVGAEKRISIRPIKNVTEAGYRYGAIDVLDQDAVDVARLKRGEVSAMAGDAAFRYVREAIRLALRGEADATVTNPLNKESLHLAGHMYAGHTEIYADLTGTKKYSMMLAHGDLRVVHVSTHVSLREACDCVKKDRVLEVIRIADEACRRLGIDSPVVGVAGLNPHSGENGLFGREEIDEIRPAIDQACAEGIRAEGPVSPDTVFSKARGGWYDVVVAMYHDQGHIPLKIVGFEYDRASGKWKNVAGVNVTLGLPIIRTSVDHGTAFDQAGKGTASETSLVSAIGYAVRMSKTGRENRHRERRTIL